MIGYLRGKLLRKSGDEILLDVGGVGYELTVTTSVLAQAEGADAEVALVVYTDMRENAIALYGFSEQSEKELFLLLKKVKGVGSRTALTVVSWMGPEELLSAIGNSDIGGLQRVPGIGKKTAERVIVELREQVGLLARDLEEHRPMARRIERIASPAGGDERVTADAVLALEKLGFPTERARSAVAATLKERGGERPEILKDPGELLRLALVHL